MITLKDHLRAKGIIIMTKEDIEQAKKFRSVKLAKGFIDEINNAPWPFPDLMQARVNGFKNRVKVIELP